MKERRLILLSIIIFLIGISSLFLSIQVFGPLFISDIDSMPKDNLISFNAKISNEYATKDGFVLELTRDEKLLAYLDYPLNSSLQGEYVFVTGRLDDELFSISSLEFNSS